MCSRRKYERTYVRMRVSGGQSVKYIKKSNCCKQSERSKCICRHSFSLLLNERAVLAGVIIIVVLLLLLPLICLIYIIMICKCLIVFEFYYRNGSGDHFFCSCCSYFGEFKLNPNRICNTSRNSSIPGGHHYSMTSIEPGPLNCAEVGPIHDWTAYQTDGQQTE